jgi:hypothetical protein
VRRLAEETALHLVNRFNIRENLIPVKKGRDGFDFRAAQGKATGRTAKNAKVAKEPDAALW